MHLRAYDFDQYKTKKKDDAAKPASVKVVIGLRDPAGAKKAYKYAEAVAGGVTIARNLVNEPPNVLTPTAFAKQAAELSKLGVDVDILDEKQLGKIGMRALLAVGQGSRQDSRVVIMRWHGDKSSKGKKSKPLAFIGKGVVFDTGGISIKPAAGMEDMKGDMAGAACVVGLMHALAARKAKVDAIGVIGLVENMPDGNAQRPGDIVKSYDGQTIEIINTDAEGRLVLCDLLAYVRDHYKPAFMINLATLTGAILVALGQENAGLFSTDDGLSDRLSASGRATGETVWRMPLGPAYDKMIDSRFADMKNTGGHEHGCGAPVAVQNARDCRTGVSLRRAVRCDADPAGSVAQTRIGDCPRLWPVGLAVPVCPFAGGFGLWRVDCHNLQPDFSLYERKSHDDGNIVAGAQSRAFDRGHLDPPEKPRRIA